jgi:L-ascorbate metabolism protein UlaG (beta-lactamase superfamily)
MKIKYLGHSCFTIETQGYTLLFDPFISGNPLSSEIDAALVQADFILVSHAHEDHTADLVSIAKRTGAVVIAIWEIHAWLQKQGISNTHPMNIGGKRTFDFGKVTMTYAMHSSSFADGTYGGVAAGFLLAIEGKIIYYSGDTALTQEMKLLGERYTIDWAILPIGGNFTMDAVDAAEAASFLRTKNVIGMHFNTFGYIVIDEIEAKTAFDNSGASLTLMNIGEEIAI